MIWKTLGIEKTDNEELIRNAYHEKLKSVNPEDDQEGFMKLRRAYEEALAYAANPDEGDKEEDSSDEKKSDVDKWIDEIEKIYNDVAFRRDESKWEAVFKSSLCDDLDTELEAGEKLLVFLMSHSNLPQKIWQLIDKRFDYSGCYEQLKERFPENFLNYVLWQAKHLSFIDYDLFDGDTTDNVDEFINKLYELKSLEEDRNFTAIDKALSELEDYSLTHPYVEVEKAYINLLHAGELDVLTIKEEDDDISDEEKKKYRHKALSIMEDLDMEYSSNLYIHRLYAEALLANGKTDNAREVYSELVENDESNYSAMLGLAKCEIVEGDYENAKEVLEDILEERVQDVDSLALLDVVNDTLVKNYTKRLEEDNNVEIAIKLGWCYYQQRKFDEGIGLMDSYNEEDMYDYINLRCRLYLAAEKYELALPWAYKWLAMIEESVDDGSKEMKKRKNRLSLAHFSLGVCIWEIKYAKSKEEGGDFNKYREEAVSYIETSIEEEHNRLVALSYMEQLARFYLEDENYEKCIDKCSEIMEIDSGFFPAYVHRQKANYKLRNAKEVIDDYFACMDIYPEYAQPYIYAAEVFYAFEQYDDVEHVIENAKEVGIESDSLKLYEIRVNHYKDFDRNKLGAVLDEIISLKKTINERTDEEPSDIEKYEDLVREHAIILWDMNEEAKALKVIDEYLKKENDNISLLNLKVDILNRGSAKGGDRCADALQICKRIYKLEPSPFSQTRLGFCYERMGQYDEALNNYEAAYEADSKYHIVVRRLMFLYSFLSNRNNDLDLVEKGIRFATEYIELTGAAEGYVERGNLDIDVYRLDEAVEDCRKAIELDETAYYAYNNLGCALLKLRRMEEAIPYLKKAIEIDPDREHLPYLNMAECYAVLGEYDEAIKTYNTIMQKFPRQSGLWREVAKMHCNQKAFDKAIALYEAHIKDAKEDVSGAKLLGNITSGNPERIKSENKLLKLYADLANVYRKAGDKDSAEKYFGKIEKRWKSVFKPSLSAKPMLELVDYYYEEGYMDKAKKLVDYIRTKISQKDKDLLESLEYKTALVYYEIGNTARAKIAAQAYVRHLKDKNGGINGVLRDKRYNPIYLYNLAMMKLASGEPKEALNYVERIKECHLCVVCECTDCFEYHYGKGLIYEALGKNEEAVALYEKAIELKGFYPEASRHLRSIKK
ncbi:MAG: tetratricopeptide repeat protein [Lachnospiraceae bacterium]|jgi:tetratricopeptide (TPR) repeat protein|nr:tetratricopeptide repeat protein [Lachnospiraceae bacterium]